MEQLFSNAFMNTDVLGWVHAAAWIAAATCCLVELEAWLALCHSRVVAACCRILSTGGSVPAGCIGPSRVGMCTAALPHLLARVRLFSAEGSVPAGRYLFRRPTPAYLQVEAGAIYKQRLLKGQ